MAKKTNRGKNGKGATGKPSARGDGIDMDAIERLMHLMTQNGVLELEVLSGPDQKVRLSRRAPDAAPMLVAAPLSSAVSHGALHPHVASNATPHAPGAAGKSGPPPGMVEFCSPMVGTFYRAANPESPPYVVTGDKIGPESVICIIEAMKVMNEIKSEIAGEIVDVLVENGEAVEYGQPLFLIKKTG